MTDIDLLPLPEEEQLANPYAHSFGSVTAYGYTDEAMRDYARANVAHATAAKDAEIEALREALAALKAENEMLREVLKDADTLVRMVEGAPVAVVECNDAKGAWLVTVDDAPLYKGQRVRIVPEAGQEVGSG